MPSPPSFVRALPKRRISLDLEPTMFPEIMRDEVFRLETRRLWLRWATMSDDRDVACLGATQHAGKAQSPSSATAGAARQTIEHWRKEAADGAALHLVLSCKGSPQALCGAVHVVPDRDGVPSIVYGLALEARGQGLMTEAVQALVDAVFMVGGLSRITACPRVGNAAGRRVLERCGFTFSGTGLDRSRARRGLEPCDQFCLDRATWRSLKGWGVPGFGAHLAGVANVALAGTALVGAIDATRLTCG